MDGTSAKDFPAFARIHWPRIRTALVEGTHRPANITLDP